MSKKVKIPLIIVLVLLFLTSIAAVAYPYISNYLAEQRQAEIVLKYDEVIEAAGSTENSKALEAARAYNTVLANGQTDDNGAFRTEGEAAHANDSPAQKPTEPIEKITGPISSAKPKELVATEPKPTEPKPTEPKPTEPKPTETIPAETEPATPTKSYSIQAAMDYGNAYAQSLGFGTERRS